MEHQFIQFIIMYLITILKQKKAKVSVSYEQKNNYH